MAGRQPEALTLKAALQDVPPNWTEQKRLGSV